MDACVSDEDPLRHYIREKLLDYALTHLTVDYIAFTENAVVDVLTQSLVKVPTTDPNSLTLPVDPFETLIRSYRLNDLPQYDQKWTTDEESVNYMRRVVAVSGKAMTEWCWSAEANLELDNSYAMRRPMSPILTTRARKATPVLGSGTHLNQLPKSFSNIIDSKLIQRIDDEVIEPSPDLRLDDVLDVKAVLDVETHAEMVALLKTVNLRPDAAYNNPYVEAFLCGSDPPARFLHPESLFVPIFPRSRILGEATSLEDQHSPKGLKNLAGLSSLLSPIEIEDDTADRYKEHMAIVDGWQTFVSSPSSIATPTSSQLDGGNQIDELFMHSSPNTDVTPIQMLMNAKMDEVEIPRTRRLGSAVEKLECTGEGQSLASFIRPFLPAPEGGRAIMAPALLQSLQHSMSTIGQATSVNEDDIQVSESPGLDADLEEDLDMAISRTYACVQGQGPEELILSEKLDEGDDQLLDVPNLPPPNIHPGSGMFLPDSLCVLVDISKGKKDDFIQDNSGQQKFLRKVKGIHSLALDLSWIPFKSNMKGITHEHGANVIEYSTGPLGECDADEVQVKMLLERFADTGSDDGLQIGQKSQNLWPDVGDNEYQTRIKEFSYAADGSEMALTRKERQRLCGIVENPPPDASDDPIIQDIQHGTENARNPDASVSDTAVLSCLIDSHSYLDDQGYIDDSGVAFTRVSDTLQDGPADANHLVFDNAGLSPISSHRREHTSGKQQHGYEGSQEGGLLKDYTTLQQFISAADGVETFLPLSFDSHRNLSSSQPRPQNSEPDFGTFAALPSKISVTVPSRPAQDLLSCSELGGSNLTHGDLATTPFSDTLKNTNAALSHAVIEFAKLRSKDINEPDAVAPPALDIQTLQVTESASELQLSVVPDELLDSKTICLKWPQPCRTTRHRYLASLDFIQKQCLVRSFRAEQSLVDLVERDTLGGVDLIVDPHSAIVFVSLHVLPSQCAALVTNLGLQSWRYSRLLVVLEAYPVHQSYRPSRGTSTAPKLNSYTPPIVKAVKKLRRDLSIAEGFGSKSSACTIYLSFANTVEEAACIARSLGDYAEMNDDSQGELWGARDWLDYSPHENEHDLASIDGMNTFAAFVILCQKPLQEFLDSSAEARLEEFGPLIGVHRVVLLNRVLDDRYQMMEARMSSGTMEDADSAAVIWADNMLENID